MHSAAQLVEPAARVNTPWWLWPNLLALDAPLVAVLWQLLLAVCFHVHLRFIQSALLGLVCWSVYAADYLRDGWTAAADVKLAPRHEFFRQHRHVMLVCLASALVAIVWLIAQLRLDLLRNGIAAGFLVIAYLSVTHFAPVRWRARWPRELAVAVLFSAGTFLCLWTRMNAGREELVLPAALFAFLCWMNVAGIECWESLHTQHQPSGSALWLVSHMPTASVAVILCAAALTALGLVPIPFCVAVALSGVAFFVLSRQQRRGISHSLMRACADAALCTPVFMLVESLWR